MGQPFTNTVMVQTAVVTISLPNCCHYCVVPCAPAASSAAAFLVAVVRSSQVFCGSKISILRWSGYLIRTSLNEYPPKKDGAADYTAGSLKTVAHAILSPHGLHLYLYMYRCGCTLSTLMDQSPKTSQGGVSLLSKVRPPSTKTVQPMRSQLQD